MNRTGREVTRNLLVTRIQILRSGVTCEVKNWFFRHGVRVHSIPLVLNLLQLFANVTGLQSFLKNFRVPNSDRFIFLEFNSMVTNNRGTSKSVAMEVNRSVCTSVVSTVVLTTNSVLDINTKV